MLGKISWRWIAVLAVAAFVAILLGLHFGVVVGSDQECRYYGDPPKKYCEPHDPAVVFLWSIKEALNAYAGAITAFATIIIAWFTRTLWRSTNALWKAAQDQSGAAERAITESAKAAAAMQAVADSMKINADQIVIAVETNKEVSARQKLFGEMQLRAYLSVVVGGATFQESARNLKFAGRPSIINTGSTVAKNVEWKIAVRIIETQLVGDGTFDYSAVPLVDGDGGMIAPHQSVTIEGVVNDYVDGGEVVGIMSGNPKVLCVWGIVRYEDVFGGEHWVRFGQALTWLPNPEVNKPPIVWGNFLKGQNETDD